MKVNLDGDILKQRGYCMKKVVLLGLVLVCTLSITGCASQQYSKAGHFMQDGDYEAALAVFDSIPDYKDTAEKIAECNQHVQYDSAVNAFTDGRYEEACDGFAPLGDFLDAESYVEQAENKISDEFLQEATKRMGEAVNKHDADLLADTLLEAENIKYGNEELLDNVTSAAIDLVNAELQKPTYDSFLFLDELIDSLDGQERLADFANELDQIRDATGEKRAAAFLSGNWVRMDGTGLNGLRMQIIITDKQSVGIVLDDIKDGNGYYKENDIKWKELSILNPTTFSFVGYSAKNGRSTTGSLSDAMGIIDYDSMRIFIHSVRNSSNYSLGDNQVMVKEGALIKSAPLTEKDFVLNFDDAVDDTGKTEVDVFHSKSAYYVSTASNHFTLPRGAGIGSNWHEVVDAYGYGISNYFKTAFETAYKKLPPEESQLLAEQADQFMDYSLDDHHIRFYFQDGIVGWILVY